MTEDTKSPAKKYIPKLVPDTCDIAMSGFCILRIFGDIKVSITLTKQELYEAFRFQEQEHYMSDIELFLEKLENEGELCGHTAAEITGKDELLVRILSAYTNNRDKYDMDWEAAAESAIHEEIENAEKPVISPSSHRDNSSGKYRLSMP